VKYLRFWIETVKVRAFKFERRGSHARLLVAVIQYDAFKRYLNSCRSQEVQPNASILSSLSKGRKKGNADLVHMQRFQSGKGRNHGRQMMDASPILNGAAVTQVSPHSDEASVVIFHVLIFSRIIKKEVFADECYKAKLKKSRGEFCNLEITLNRLIHSDFPLLIEALSATKLYGLDAVDVHLESCGVLPNGEDVLALLTAVNERLRSVNLSTFWKDILRCMPNLMCLSMCETRLTNIFMTSAALSKLPSLMELRFQNCLCCHDTRPCPTSSCTEASTLAHEEILNSHQNSYAHAEPSLTATENFLCQTMRQPHGEEILFSDDESFVSHEFTQGTTESSDESELDFSSYQQGRDVWLESSSPGPSELDRLTNLKITVNQPKDAFLSLGSPSTSMPFHHPFGEDVNSLGGDKGLKYEYNTSELDTVAGPMNVLSSSLLTVGELTVGESNQQFQYMSQSSARELLMKDEEGSPNCMLGTIGSSDHIHKKFISHHPSPICFEKNYREYMIASLPRLKVLDNVLISNMERDKSAIVFTQHYEYLPYNRRHKESVVSVLWKRELGTNLQSSYVRQHYPSRPSIHAISRSLAAAKVGSNPWPRAKAVSKFKSIVNEENKGFRPRQFEYHPSDPSLMVFGTLDGELVVINHESGKLVAYLPSAGALNSILGLCWLKKYPSKLIAGSDNGSLQLYDIHQMPTTITDRYCNINAVSFSFDDFEQLTSVHVNATDESFLASGFSKHVALYDISNGRRLQVFKDLHQEHINVVKFSNHSPSVFATASFDQEIKLWDLRQGMSRPCYTAFSSRGNVMVCFSHDDHYLLSSAVDNEVKQLLAVDGRLHMSFKISPTGSAHNYTRSYYMNGRDYVISGSCEENVVRLCCAQTGRRLRDIPLEDFHMSVLAAYLRPCSKSEILKVNLVESGNFIKEDPCVKGWEPLNGMGG
ncbi:hypothetical protein Taro_031510, partial [Colocasia esculenta]|nr:hypothetical protein [Colocasia esculenta]